MGVVGPTAAAFDVAWRRPTPARTCWKQLSRQPELLAAAVGAPVCRECPHMCM